MPIILKADSATTNGFLKEASSHMKRFLKVTDFDNLLSYSFQQLQKQFMLLLAASGNPLFDKIGGFMNFLLVGIELEITSRFQ
jgi:hypothetical protein